MTSSKLFVAGDQRLGDGGGGGVGRQALDHRIERGWAGAHTDACSLFERGRLGTDGQQHRGKDKS